MKTTKTARPLKLTLTGDFAEEVREASRSTGLRPTEIMTSHLRQGLLLTGDSAEAREFQLETAASHLGIPLEAARAMHEESVSRTAEHFAMRRALAGTSAKA